MIIKKFSQNGNLDTVRRKGLKPFEHCVLVRQARGAHLESKGGKLLVQHDRDMRLFRSSQDFHAGSISRRSAEEVLDSFKGYFTELSLSTSPRRNQRPASSALDRLPSIYTPLSLTFLKCTRRTTSKQSSLYLDSVWC